jgi:hypothetical protein
MQIYVAHSTNFDYKKELYEPLRGSELFQQHQFVLPHEHSGDPFNSKEFLRSCDLLVAEVSFASTGMGIELGWADLIGVPIICFYRTGSVVSGSLKSLTKNILEYNDMDDFLVKLTDFTSQP